MIKNKKEDRMTRVKNQTQITVLIGIMLLLLFGNSFAQVDLNDTKLHETKIFTKNPIVVLQSLYLDSDGMPSHDQFLKANGLDHQNSEIESIPYFTVSFATEDIIEKNGNYKPTESANLLNLDFYIKTKTEFNSRNIGEQIWDGRAYEDNNNLIVSGYSSNVNERPVGKINYDGTFTAQLDGVDAKEFPLLNIPAEQILFDPFEWKLLKIKSSDGKIIQESTNSFLPVNIYDTNDELLNNVTYKFENNSATSSLVLYGLIDGKKTEIANCNLKNSKIVKSKIGFKPGLIEGCSQPTNGNVITLTFQGNYSNNISLDGSHLQLNNEAEYITDNSKIENNRIDVDGDFSDWRNISGTSDVEGDYVSYLFANPDTDLLEFKITNDDKYLYLYSRVVGAHGRTGDKGRYYWYSYIDVDQNAVTGYPPTRDDNCYFGIPIGDDSEAQFEFISDTFVKTFFGFTGVGAEKEALSGVLELGPSYYATKGRDGKQRDSYKVEYVNREGSRSITHDYTVGTSEDIIVALSPDGSEVEVKVELVGFLKDKTGKMLVHVGKKIDIAIGVEGSSKFYGSSDWGADSSPVVYGYELK